MSTSKVYRYHCYIAGIKIPINSCVISSQFGSIANLSLSIGYSPYINHIFPFTKVQVYEQKIDDGILYEPTLEFDGSIVAVSRSKNLIGSVSIQLTCLTDGYIWNRRKQYDFYLQDITSINARGTGDDLSIRSDSQIQNFFGECISANKFDVGCAVASVLTSTHKGKSTTGKDRSITSYTYQYNGKQYKKQLIGEVNEANSQGLTPEYYSKVIDKYGLSRKLFGIATSPNVQEFFRQDRFMKLLNNAANDLQGENTFWSIASYILNYGFYNVYDIPNPVFLNKTASEVVDLNKDISTSNDSKDKDIDLSETPEIVEQNRGKIAFAPGSNNSYGLAEFLLKPVSVLSIPYQCNIIWPDQVVAENITYDFMNSPTRVILQRQEIPGQENEQNVILTSSVFTGPVFTEDSRNLFYDLLPNGVEFGPGDIRANDIYSKHEKQYGITYHRLELSYAFDSTLLNARVKKDEDSTTKIGTNINKFLNYEFSQKFFSARSYQLQVTPDVDVIPGLPVVVLNKNGDHVIAFCIGKAKSWQADGAKGIQLNLAYPRYHNEDVGQLGNIVDPTCSDLKSMKELCYLTGSIPLCGIGDGDGDYKIISSIDDLKNVSLTEVNNNLSSIIDQLFDDYQNDNTDGKGIIKNKYKRNNICTLNNFMTFHNIDAKYKNTELPEFYPSNKFDSNQEESSLSTNSFTVYDNKERIDYNGHDSGDVKSEKINSSGIVKKHIEWIKTAKRI